jgi:hypothetical protein
VFLAAIKEMPYSNKKNRSEVNDETSERVAGDAAFYWFIVSTSQAINTETITEKNNFVRFGNTVS